MISSFFIAQPSLCQLLYLLLHYLPHHPLYTHNFVSQHQTQHPFYDVVNYSTTRIYRLKISVPMVQNISTMGTERSKFSSYISDFGFRINFAVRRDPIYPNSTLLKHDSDITDTDIANILDYGLVICLARMVEIQFRISDFGWNIDLRDILYAMYIVGLLNRCCFSMYDRKHQKWSNSRFQSNTFQLKFLQFSSPRLISLIWF